MAYQQVSKLFLRGSLCTKILRNLTQEQKEEIDDIIDLVMHDPNLQHCKIEFCNALANTIRNDYTNREYGEQDYRIAIMRAAVAARHGYNGNPPSPSAIDDPPQRKKWFQTWAFNYLRQILRENKLPVITNKRTITVPAERAALHLVGETIRDCIKQQHDHKYKRTLKGLYKKIDVDEFSDGFLVKFDHWSFPIELVQNIRKLSIMYFTHHVAISQDDDGILIRKLAERTPLITLVQKTEDLVRIVSFDTDYGNDTNQRDALERLAIQHDKQEDDHVEIDDMIATLRERLPDDAKPIFDIYNEDTRPNDYITQYGDGRPRICHVAEYLDISTREVKRLLKVIKHHCLALGVGAATY